MVLEKLIRCDMFHYMLAKVLAEGRFIDGVPDTGWPARVLAGSKADQEKMRETMLKFRALMAVMILPFLALGACETPGDESRPDVYDQSQVNSLQRGRVVQIISVSVARVNVDNARNRRTAQIVGGLLGAALGSGLATGVGGSGWGGGLGAGAGGAAGGALLGGQVVGNQTIVRGVTIAYQDRAGGEVFLSTQVGKRCEYQPGTALLVSTGGNGTRVQPNAACPRQ